MKSRLDSSEVAESEPKLHPPSTTERRSNKSEYETGVLESSRRGRIVSQGRQEDACHAIRLSGLSSQEAEWALDYAQVFSVGRGRVHD